MNKFFLYGHGGSGNHGCEAIVRSTVALLRECTKEHLYLISSHPEEDRVYGIDSLCTILPEKTQYPKCSVEFLSAYLRLKLKQDYIPLDKLEYKKAFDHVQKGDIALSIGGDNYCYADVQRYIMMHDMMLKRGAKTVLWGCSVEPELLKNEQIALDIAKYSLITARETISYEALKNVNPNTILVPDSAFTLETVCKPLPDGFEAGKYVGLNVSPMVIAKETIPGIVLDSYDALIRYILDTTDMKIMLIHHVVWGDGDDRIPLRKLLTRYEHTGRIAMIKDCSCTELKGYISRCRFFIGARTHATIAAYSSCVPTLVVGYSVKARGIARDLFATEDKYTLPAQQIKQVWELQSYFQWLMERETAVRKQLENKMPSYIAKTDVATTAISRLL